MRIMEIPRYCPTNSYVLVSPRATVLIDTGLPSTFPRFAEALRAAGLSVSDITHMVATHFHPDHIGLMPRLSEYGIPLVVFGEQPSHLHDSDYIFARDAREHADPIDDEKVVPVGIEDSRSFLASFGIGGEVVPLPSHSPDSIGVMLDNRYAFVGDLTPLGWIDIDTPSPTSADWQRVLSYEPAVVCYGHVPTARVG